MKKTHDIAISNGEYQQNGVTKKRWITLGSVFTDERTGRQSIKLDVMPVGVPDFEGWMGMFPVQDRDQQPPQTDDPY